MSLTLFLLLCLGAIVYFLIGTRPNVVVNGAIWLLLGVTGLFTLESYIYPTDKVGVFGNSDYHVLEHVGWGFQDTLMLVNEDSSDLALWDENMGKAQIIMGNPFKLEMEDLFVPFYRFEEEDQQYHLVNPVYSEELKGSLVVKGLNGNQLTLNWEEFPNGDSAHYQVAGPKGKIFPCKFKKYLKYGYPVLDIIKTSDLQSIDPEIKGILEGAYLLRPVWKQTPEENSTFLFFPGPDFQPVDSLLPLIGSSRELTRQFSIDLMPKQRFFFGLGVEKSAVFSLNQDEEGARIQQEFPGKYKLRNEEKNQLFLCTAKEDVAANGSDAGIFVQVPKGRNNINHINGHLTYYHGPANEILEIKVIDHLADGKKKEIAEKLIGGQEFRMKTRAAGTNLNWIFNLTDLHKSNPVQPWKMRGFLILIIFLALLTEKMIGYSKLNPLESAVFVLVFAFITVRILLQWRMITFPPIGEVSMEEYNFLRSGNHFLFTIGFTLVFFLIRWFFIPINSSRSRVLQKLDDLATGLRNGLQDKWDTFTAAVGRSKVGGHILDSIDEAITDGVLWKNILLYLFSFTVLGLIIFAGFTAVGKSPKRFIDIFLPVLLYFFFTSKNFLRKKKSYRADRMPDSWTVTLFLITFAYLVIRDAGFSIVFLLFTILFQLIIELLEVERSRGIKEIAKNFALPIILGVVFLSILFFGDSLVVFLFNNPSITLYALALPCALGASAYIIYSLIQELPDTGRKFGYAGGVVLVLAILFAVWYKFPEELHKKEYIKYRAALLTQDVGEVINDQAFDSGEITRILQVSQNKWFIDSYLDQSEDDQSSRYFNLKPHFKKGASYFAQATDIVVARYMIAEHGRFPVIILIVIFLIMGAGFSLQYGLKRLEHPLGMAATWLLFVISLFVWLTATNRFVFFGQDFPLISLTSLFTLVFTFGCLLLSIIRLPRWDRPRISDIPGILGKISVPILIAVIGFFVWRKDDPESASKMSNFSINLSDAKASISNLNETFLAYQEGYEIADIPNSSELDSLVQSFYFEYLSPEDTVFSRDNNFVQSAFAKFVRAKEERMDPSKIIHMVRNEYGRYEFAVNGSYYLIPPPSHRRKEWLGNLLAAQAEEDIFLIDMKRFDSYIPVPSSKFRPSFQREVEGSGKNMNIAIIPSNWVKSGSPCVILWDYDQQANQKNFYLSNHDLSMGEYGQSLQNPAVRLLPNDFVTFKGRGNSDQAKYKYVEGHAGYLAKNIWVNGKQKMFFPLGEKSLWAYHYANSVAKVYSDSGNIEKDVRVSLEGPLVSDVYDLVEDHFKGNPHLDGDERLGVIAINGEGSLRLMVDYRKGKVPDPNDIDDINDYRWEFYKFRSNANVRDIFGNINLQGLRAGPGSTMKPIVYSAVSSQFNLGWESLFLPATNPSEVRPDGVIEWYGGKKVRLKWQMPNYEFAECTSQRYLEKSINPYHSLVVFLGSYEEKQLQGWRQKLSDPKQSIFRPWGSAPAKEMYPPVVLGGQRMGFNPENWPAGGDDQTRLFGNKSSIMANGLFSNYGLATYKDRSLGSKTLVSFDPIGHKSIFESEGNLASKYWSYPVLSHYYQEDRVRHRNDTRPFLRGIMQSVVHGLAVMKMSPSKMAEQGLRLASLDRSRSLSLTDAKKGDATSPFKVKGGWASDEAYFQFVKSTIYTGMKRVLVSGTGKVLGQELRKRAKDHPSLAGLNFYGKTGTTSAGPKDKDDKLFLLIVSKGQLESLSTSELAENKIYVFFFTGSHFGNAAKKDVRGYYSMLADIVAKTSDSWYFKNYMEL